VCLLEMTLNLDADADRAARQAGPHNRDKGLLVLHRRNIGGARSCAQGARGDALRRHTRSGQLAPAL